VVVADMEGQAAPAVPSGPGAGKRAVFGVKTGKTIPEIHVRTRGRLLACAHLERGDTHA